MEDAKNRNGVRGLWEQTMRILRMDDAIKEWRGVTR